jgi:hypothetical protein
MLQFLLDEHISPAVARGAIAKYPGIKITTLAAWRGGSFLGTSDAVFLSQAAKDGLTLVTYDQRTIRPLLKVWLESGVHHGGVVFVDQRTLSPRDFGGLIRSLGQLWKAQRRLVWTNRVVFLRRESA